MPVYDRGASRREAPRREVHEDRGRGRERQQQRGEAPRREVAEAREPDRGRVEQAAPQRQEAAAPPARGRDEDRGDRGGRGAERGNGERRGGR